MRKSKLHKQHEALERHFLKQHENPPAPFNPDHDPRADEWRRLATESMERDGFYNNRTREECKTEWLRRYENFKKGDKT